MVSNQLVSVKQNEIWSLTQWPRRQSLWHKISRWWYKKFNEGWCLGKLRTKDYELSTFDVEASAYRRSASPGKLGNPTYTFLTCTLMFCLSSLNRWPQGALEDHNFLLRIYLVNFSLLISSPKIELCWELQAQLSLYAVRQSMSSDWQISLLISCTQWNERER